MSDPLVWFRQSFQSLTANTPFAWQEALFQQLLQSDYPEQINIPTGCGKTALLHVWLLALAYSAMSGTKLVVPRRLIWVVNNRVVVDQATTEALALAEMLAAPTDALRAIADALHELPAVSCIGSSPLAVSTLRGERADNREWSHDPARPAIIVGTVDMIGSRLLFRGYGDSRKRRARHAGLLGRDSLIVNDEAHLTPAFLYLLKQVRAAQPANPVRVIALSATPRETGSSFPSTLDHDLANPEFRARVESRKVLRLCGAADVKAQRARVLELARESRVVGAKRTLVYVSSPEEAARIAAELRETEGDDRVFLLTGTMRGLERDKLNESGIFRCFLARTAADDAPVWGVMTAAGEVGVNLTAERLISELDTADHLLQRFGRLNRFGQAEGEAFVVWSDKPPQGRKNEERDTRLSATRAYLERLPATAGAYDISPLALWHNPPEPAALSESAAAPPLLPWLVESWALTSINRAEWPDLPKVEPWLHGAQDDEPVTQVAWREEVSQLAQSAPADIEAILKAHPVLAHERLQEPTYRVLGKLQELAEGAGDQRVIVQRSDGTAESLPLKDVSFSLLTYSLVLLPPEAGNLTAGMFDTGRPESSPDVADLPGTGPDGVTRCRFLFEPDDGWSVIRLGADGSAPIEITEDRLTPQVLRNFGSQQGLVLRDSVALGAAADTSKPQLVLACYSSPRPSDRDAQVGLSEHTSAVLHAAGRLVAQLGLGPAEAEAICLAAQHHDEGKRSPVWQAAAGNLIDSGAPLAKAPHINWRMLAGYRHELGSLVNTHLPADTLPETADLALHLIAAHHGWARPHFPDDAADRSCIVRSRAASAEAPHRFARLQERYSPWGLAYLEAVFCAADSLASAAAKERSAHA